MKQKTAYLGMFLALALICSYVESLIPFDFGIPGVKLGLANTVAIMILYYSSVKEACIVSILRIVLSGFLFGNPFSILYGLCGGMLSLAAMAAMKRTNKFQVVSVSVTGGMFHNIGQLLIASAVVENYHLFYYMPVLLISGSITGFLIGMVTQEIMIRWKGHG